MTEPRSNGSAWSPLQHPVFRAIWLATVVSNLGTWIQNVGAAWLMTSLSPSALMVALIQTATSLPMFLLALPAGALADVINRRKLLLFTQAWMLLMAAALAVVTWLGLMNPTALLLLTFLLGLGAALNGPAWQAIVPELVPKAELALSGLAQQRGVQYRPGRRPGHRRFGHRGLWSGGDLRAECGLVCGSNRSALPLEIRPKGKARLPAERFLGSNESRGALSAAFAIAENGHDPLGSVHCLRQRPLGVAPHAHSQRT